MIRDYLDEALPRAEYSPLEDGSFATAVRGLRGVIATGGTLEECRETLQEVVEERKKLRAERLGNVTAAVGCVGGAQLAADVQARSRRLEERRRPPASPAGRPSHDGEV